MKSVTFPSSLRKIHESTFQGCTALTALELPEELEEIGALAFFACENLKEIRISESNPFFETIDGVHKGEEISVYGYESGSQYIKIDEALSGNEIWISSPYKKKFMLKEGDTITLKEKYEDKSYDFVIKGVYDYDGALCIFLPQESFNKTFGLSEDAFTGYLSQNAISDIDYENIYTVVTIEDVMAIATQLDHSMGGMMDMVSWVCLIMAILMMYLLTMIIIEKNATSISMVKVLGYENGEINSLYILLT